ncbi:MAG: hypothetical protein OJF51_004173 [Nitrospira sp.]|jgi:hypothetical protein|nr:MAG: hypothetical protein OJF51_004173 [Nitrospira sp.]
MDEERKKQAGVPETEPHRVRLPGWLVKEEIGLGDLVKKITYRSGIKPCAGCEKRAATLNHWMVISRR